MKSSSTLLMILVFQAVLATGILAAAAKENGGRQSEKTDPRGPLITPGSLKCCSKCNFSPPGLFTCDDLVKKCDRICTKCVKNGKQGLFQCRNHFLGNTIACGPPCKNHH